MKKFIPLLLVTTILTGCETTQPNNIQSSSDTGWYSKGSQWFFEDTTQNKENKPKKVTKKDKTVSYKVFQVFHKGSLAFKCDGNTDYCRGTVVLIPDTVVKQSYDGLVITLKNPKVIDTYSYTTKEDKQKTVPIISGRYIKDKDTNISKRYKVFQVISKGSLANSCENNKDYCVGTTVLIPNSVVKQSYNDLIITLKNPKVVSTYSYTSTSDEEVTVPVLSGTSSKEKLKQTERYKVFQVFHKGSLASSCGDNKDYCVGTTVLIPKTVVKKPYDDMIITLMNPKIIDTYSYTSTSDKPMTVPIITGTVQ